MASALAHIACQHGYNVCFIRANEMLRTLRASRLDNSRDAEMIALSTVDRLVLDDFALEPMSKEESRDVYQPFLEGTGRASMIVTSNRDTAEWISMFDDLLLAQSAVALAREAAARLCRRSRACPFRSLTTASAPRWSRASAPARRSEAAAIATGDVEPPPVAAPCAA